MVHGRTAAIAASWMILIAIVQLASAGIASASDAAAKPDAAGDFVPQVSVWQDLAELYPEAQKISFAIAAVPDPRVPRYRRFYDLDIEALQLGMLSEGYTLDRWSVPWLGANVQKTAEKHPQRDFNFGVLIFRCDTWRYGAKLTRDVCNGRLTSTERKIEPGFIPESRFRVIYLVPETATQGVDLDALTQAVGQIEMQLPTEPSGAGTAEASDPRIGMLSFPNLSYPNNDCAASSKTLLILGPTFSGSLDSIRAHRKALIDHPKINGICLISSSASAISNPLVDPDLGADSSKSQSPESSALHFNSLVVPDFRKFAKMALLAKWILPDRDVAILSESSVFGYGAGHDVCQAVAGLKSDPGSVPELGEAEARALGDFCQRLHVIYFPPTIADIRYGLSLQQQQAQTAVASAAKNVLPTDHLRLDLGADDGTEFPDSHQSSLTAASLQISLDRAMDEVKAVNPSMVIVVATDVRDRLFLFDQLRQRLPTAILADLETDNLLTHPDFLHASRGALALASGNMNTESPPGSGLYGCENAGPAQIGESVKIQSVKIPIPRAHQFWPTDVHGIFADAVSRLRDPDQQRDDAPCAFPSSKYPRREVKQRNAILNVVSFDGFKPVSKAYPELPGRDGNGVAPRLAGALEIYAPLMCLLLPWLWLPGVWPEGFTGRLSWMVSLRRYNLILTTALLVPALLIAVGIRRDSAPEISYSPLIALTVLALVGSIGVWFCARRLDDADLGSASDPKALQLDRRQKLRDFCAAAIPAVIAFGVAFVPWLRVHADTDALLFGDERLLFALGSNLAAGLAFYGVIVLGVFVMLYASAVIATAAHLVRRDLKLVRHAEIEIQTKAKPPVGEADNTAGNVLEGNGLIGRNVFVILGFILAAIGLECLVGGIRFTVFGRVASIAAFLAVCASTLFAGFSLAVCYGAGQRVRILSGFVQSRFLARNPDPLRTKEIPGFWHGAANAPVRFAPTPVLARLSQAGAISRRFSTVKDVTRWGKELTQLLSEAADDNHHRLALFALLVSEVSIFRWLVLATLGSTLASVTMIYLFPIEADILVCLNLLLLVATGVLSGFMAAAFERDGVLSNILCNRPKKAAWSSSLFGFVVVPFIVLAIAILVAEIPGVIDWGGGVLSLLAVLGIHS
jgi:hypothetical protein